MQINAQLPQVVISDSLILDESKSDEFNETYLDGSKWWCVDACNDTDSINRGYNWSAGAFFRPENVTVSNGNLELKVDFNPDSLDDSVPCIHHHPYTFYSGGIISVLRKGEGELGPIGNYRFGYYEMKAKLPGYYDSDLKPVGFGLMPTFWIYYQHWIGPCVDKHDEVDILEPDTYQYYDAETNVVGWHDEYDTCGAHKIGQDSMRSSTPLFESYHTYGMELLPNKITFYFDDQPFYSADTVTSPGIAHSLDMSPYLCVVMDIQMGGFNRPAPEADAPFPEWMYVDYFRYYRPKQEVLSTNILFQNSPNPVTGNTEIGFNIAANTKNVSLNIYDLTGSQIKSFQLTEKGKSKITLLHSDFKPGIYFYSLCVNNLIVDTKKMVVVQ